VDSLHALLDALDRIGDRPGKAVSAHLDPALSEAAKAAVALGASGSVSAFTGQALERALRSVALRHVLDEHYGEHPEDRPTCADVALHLARARALPAAGAERFVDALRAMEAAMPDERDPEALLAATVAHLSLLAA
jgi:hypothetical protein